MIKVLFFGSFQTYSGLILSALTQNSNINLVGVVTTPAKPVGRKQQLTKSPVQIQAEKLSQLVFTPDILTAGTLTKITEQIPQPDLILTAGYGKLLPPPWLKYPKITALNLHFSLLPKYRGACPAEWALLSGERETGITLIEMSPELDRGKIVDQAKINIQANDTRETLYQKLYQLGALKIGPWLQSYCQNPSSQLQPKSPTPYASKLSKADSLVAWELISACLDQSNQSKTSQFSPLLESIFQNQKLNQAEFLARAIKALQGFPEVWTLVPTSKGAKRMKLLSAKVTNNRQQLILDKVQIEGQKPALWNQVKNILELG